VKGEWYRPSRWHFLGVSLLLGASLSTATAQKPLVPERQDLRNIGGDVWSIWTSPAHIQSSDLAPMAGAVTLLTVVAFRDSAVWNWIAHHPNTLVIRLLGPIREGWRFPAYELGSGQYLLPLSGVAYTVGRLTHNIALRDAGLGCAAGHLSSLGVRAVVLRLVARARPRVTPEPFQLAFPGSKDWSHQSFLSGHASNSMSCASFLGHRFSLGAAEPLPYLYSAAIGLGRMADGRHWASDTMAGAMMGFAIGKGIADRQLSRVDKERALATARMPLLQWSITF
jgi:membrane-associated phospholipid phosphatase